MKTPIIPIERAGEETVTALIESGILYVDDQGLHVTENRPPRCQQDACQKHKNIIYVLITARKEGEGNGKRKDKRVAGCHCGSGPEEEEACQPGQWYTALLEQRGHAAAYRD